MKQAIELVAVGKRYAGVAALDAVSATLPAGKVVGLIGHNGAGKSTLIKLVLGLVAPTSGTLAVLGGRPWNHPALRQRIGYLPENANFQAQLSGRELLRFFADLKQAPRAQVDTLLERVGLASAAGRRVGTWSKGMRQRLGLAQALLGRPELVLLDEPATGLDPEASRELYRLIGELRDAGASVLVSSHLLAELEPHIDTALILRQGRLVAAGPLAALSAAAGLPARLVLDVHTAQRGGLIERLSAQHLPPLVRGDGRIELRVPRSAKLETMRRCLADAAVADIDVREPSLAELYDHLAHAAPVPETGA